MADKTLVPGSTDYSQAASWSPSGVPTGTDNVFIVDGNQTMTAGFSALSAVTLGKVVVGRDFRGSLSNGTGAFQIGGASAVTIELRDSGFHNLNVGTCTDLRVRKLGNSRLIISGGTITRADFWDGHNVLVGAATEITNGYNSGADVTIEDNATGITMFIHRKGISKIKRDVATWYHHTGEGRLQDTAEITTRLYVLHAAGIFYANGGDIADIFGFAGKFTAAGALADFTIGAAATPEMFDGFEFDTESAAADVTLPTAIRLHNHSNTLLTVAV